MLSDKILVVDDDPRIISSVKLALSEYDVQGFLNGEEVIKYLKKPSDASLVLLDVFMGNQNGIDVLNEIKEFNKNMSVIIMTGYGSMDLAVQALRFHADDFLEKPFDVKELRDKIKVLLREQSFMNPMALNDDERVSRIKRFVNRNYSNISLECIADEMCLSMKYISRMFKEKSKNSFRNYKLSVKVEKAKELLTKSSYNVTQIAETMGYQNPESFMRIFKKMTRLTPSQYRKKHGKPKRKTLK